MFMVPAAADAISTGYQGETPVTAGTGINYSVHDLRRENTFLAGYKASPDDYLDRLCIFCHAPHHAYRLSTATTGTGVIAPEDYTYLPLWNHDVTNQVFQEYYNGPDQPIDGMKRAQSIDFFDRIGSVSLLCLSCHDGTVAVNSYGNAPQDVRSISTGAQTMGLQYRIGGDGYLANHHPIGFYYDAVAAVDWEIIPSDLAIYEHDLDIVVGANPAYPVTPVNTVLPGGKMECNSCHAVHNKGNSGEKLLYVSDQNSNLCFSCHDKGYKTLDGGMVAIP
jgi:predicted CXXCH cytochrome family protein